MSLSTASSTSSTSSSGSTSSLTSTSSATTTTTTSSRYTRGPGYECRTPASPPSVYTTPVWAPRPADGLKPLGGRWLSTPLDAVPAPHKEAWVAPGAERFASSRPLPVCIPALALRSHVHSRARATPLPEVRMERSVRHYPSRRFLPENHYFRVRKDQAMDM